MLIVSEHVPVLEKQLEYMINLFTVARNHGNFWFYRNELRKRGLKPQLLGQADLPNINFEVPRWLATDFVLDKTTDDQGGIEHFNPRPYLWEYHHLPRSWNSPDEAALLLKMGIEGERRRHAQ